MVTFAWIMLLPSFKVYIAGSRQDKHCLDCTLHLSSGFVLQSSLNVSFHLLAPRITSQLPRTLAKCWVLWEA